MFETIMLWILGVVVAIAVVALSVLIWLAYQIETEKPCKKYGESTLVLIPIIVGKVQILQPYWLPKCIEK